MISKATRVMGATNQIEHLHKRLHELHAGLSNHLDRLVGCAPPRATNTGTEEVDTPASQLDAPDRAVEMCHVVATRLGETAERLRQI